MPSRLSARLLAALGTSGGGATHIKAWIDGVTDHIHFSQAWLKGLTRRQQKVADNLPTKIEVPPSAPFAGVEMDQLRRIVVMLVHNQNRLIDLLGEASMPAAHLGACDFLLQLESAPVLGVGSIPELVAQTQTLVNAFVSHSSSMFDLTLNHRGDPPAYLSPTEPICLVSSIEVLNHLAAHVQKHCVPNNWHWTPAHSPSFTYARDEKTAVLLANELRAALIHHGREASAADTSQVL